MSCAGQDHRALGLRHLVDGILAGFAPRDS
jgi:hypothetical protein